MDRVCEEINDKLQVSGQVVITELSREFRLPLDFINQVWKYVCTCMYTQCCTIR